MTTTTRPGEEGRIQVTSEEVQKTVDTSKWFPEDVKIPLQARTLLEQYSGFAPDEVLPHVADLRARAFQAWPYPCIGQLRFLQFTTATHPSYPDIISRLKSGQTFVDAGCCLGQDLRKLLFDGAPSSASMYGMDIEPAFFDLGYELFRDRENMQATFLATDLTKASIPSIESLKKSIDIISAQSLFHLFTLDDQKTVAKHLVVLTKANPGSVIAGRQVGTRKAGVHKGMGENTAVFAHNVDSLAQFWDDVGAATNTKWEVVSQVEEAPERVRKQVWAPEDVMILTFTATRQ
ncbi:hypothetical protein MMC17_001558 [Xylographa soralifera]|nr:hypothetical protein [Xylographa soralifera]